MPETDSTRDCPTWKLWLREIAEVWDGGMSRLVPRLWIILGAIALGAVLVLTVSPTDVYLQQKVRMDNNPSADTVASFLSRYGDLNVGSPLAALIWLAGALRNKVRWRKLGLACLMAGLIAGLIVNIFRTTTGRPRPYAEQPFTDVVDRFYGPKWSPDYQSYPSGHATSSSATGMSLGGAVPALAIPGALYAVSVSWSRVQLDKHHPIDVAVGAVIGTTVGLCFASTVPGAWICLRQRKKKDQAEFTRKHSDNAES